MGEDEVSNSGGVRDIVFWEGDKCYSAILIGKLKSSTLYENCVAEIGLDYASELW